ncbi:helix-turn-helix domain-containing protein [Tibeticola sp.]|uniref:helix-turn-helix domain-containing protein n=1 Tax=Tibeticola sp. TaxID=2005368 RepID=UPI0025CD6FC3|nr:helix-turn-helix domain-containing protein [Tibeticola sp.]
MSDTGAIPEGQAFTGEGAGAMLRAAREAAGLHVAALAVSLKIPVRRLEALEAERWDELPGAVFTRALAASVCRNLKIDPEPVLARLPAAPRSQLAESERPVAPFREGAPTTSGSRLSAPFEGSRALALVVGALVLGAVLLWVWPFVAPQFAQPPAAEPQPAPVQEPAQASTPPSSPAQEPAATAPAQPAPTAVVESAAPASPGPTAAAASAPASVAAPVTAGTGRALLALSARGDSWIEVTDARGTVVLRRLLKDGETAQLDAAAAPLNVLVGRADVTDVKVRGEPFDLAPLARNNVARFEVK